MWFSSCLRVFVVAFVLVAAVQAQAPDVSVTPIARDGQVLVSFDLTDAFSSDVRDAIQSGLPTTFSYDVELRRGSALFDRTVASVTVAASVRFDNLTRRYQISRTVDGRVEDARPTEDQEAVRRWLTHFEQVPLSNTSALETNGEYYVRVRGAHAAAQHLVPLAVGPRRRVRAGQVHVHSVGHHAGHHHVDYAATFEWAGPGAAAARPPPVSRQPAADPRRHRRSWSSSSWRSSRWPTARRPSRRIS